MTQYRAFLLSILVGWLVSSAVRGTFTAVDMGGIAVWCMALVGTFFFKN